MKIAITNYREKMSFILFKTFYMMRDEISFKITAIMGGNGLTLVLRENLIFY